MQTAQQRALQHCSTYFCTRCCASLPGVATTTLLHLRRFSNIPTQVPYTSQKKKKKTACDIVAYKVGRVHSERCTTAVQNYCTNCMVRQENRIGYYYTTVRTDSTSDVLLITHLSIYIRVSTTCIYNNSTSILVRYPFRKTHHSQHSPVYSRGSTAALLLPRVLLSHDRVYRVVIYTRCSFFCVVRTFRDIHVLPWYSGVYVIPYCCCCCCCAAKSVPRYNQVSSSSIVKSVVSPQNRLYGGTQ